MKTPTKDETIRELCRIILETLKDTGTDGAPSGVLYAAFMAQGLTLESYLSLIDGLRRLHYVKVKGDLVYIAPEGSEWLLESTTKTPA